MRFDAYAPQTEFLTFHDGRAGAAKWVEHVRPSFDAETLDVLSHEVRRVREDEAIPVVRRTVGGFKTVGIAVPRNARRSSQCYGWQHRALGLTADCTMATRIFQGLLPVGDARTISGIFARTTMSTLTIQLPDSIRAQVEELAMRDGITTDQFLATAAAEKVSALRTVDFLKAEAEQGRAEDWDFVLSLVPARPPLPGDELP